MIPNSRLILKAVSLKLSFAYFLKPLNWIICLFFSLSQKKTSLDHSNRYRDIIHKINTLFFRGTNNLTNKPTEKNEL